ncbi:hypothetical protein ACRAWF_20525 [Streptomyces sp. L7]
MTLALFAVSTLPVAWLAWWVPPHSPPRTGRGFQPHGFRGASPAGRPSSRAAHGDGGRRRRAPSFASRSA